VSKAKRLKSIEVLEERRLLAFGYWPTFLNMDDVFTKYPWLDGGGNSVAVIDKGIDYYHPLMGGNEATNTIAPRIVNVFDYRDNDNTPFPTESEATDLSSAHGTGVAGLLIADPHTDTGGNSYKGILQDPDSKIYNLRIDRHNSQPTIKAALQWVLANYESKNITAVNLTDFVGAGSTPSYEPELQALKAAGVFIASPVANDWILQPNPRGPIGWPAASPYVFGIGGIKQDGTLRDQTQRGPELDVVGPAESVTLPYYIPSTNQHPLLSVGTGNSWATPHVVGLAVLLKQIDPTLTPDQIMQVIQDSGVQTPDPDPVSNPNGTVFYSRLDFLAAVNHVYATRDDIYDQGSGGSDDLGHAGVISLVNGTGSINNLKLFVGDTDYYKFDVAAVGDYKVSVGYGGASSFPAAQLLDSGGGILDTIKSDGVSRRLSPGTYYLKLQKSSTLDGTYSVNVAPDSPPAGLGAGAGTFNTIAYDSAGALHFAWFDQAAGKLKYAKRTDNTWSSVQIVDAAASTGNFMSMALDSTGKPGVAYYDEANTALKYAYHNGSSWGVQTVDADLTTGYYPSIKFAAPAKPVIAYYYKSSGDLRFAAYTGSSWAISTVDSRGDVGRYPSLALNPTTGRWGIAYEKTTTGDFRVAEQTKAGWAITVVDPTKFGGGFVSMAYSTAGRPSFSYYDAFNADLKYARYTGSKWVTQAVAAKNSQGLYTSLALDPASGGEPVIYYFNKTANAAMIARSEGGAWSFETAATGGGRGVVLALDADARETFTWLEDGTGRMRVSKWA